MFDFLIKLLSYFRNLYAEICLGVLTMPLVSNGEIANVAARILIDEEWENIEFQNKYLIVTTKSEQFVVFLECKQVLRMDEYRVDSKKRLQNLLGQSNTRHILDVVRKKKT